VLEARAAEVGDEDFHNAGPYCLAAARRAARNFDPRLNGYFRKVSRTSRSGRGMTWALTNSPLALAACEPASTAARTEPTSPRTKVATKAPPICTWPARVTLAALHIASVAEMVAIRPLVSIMPRASLGP